MERSPYAIAQRMGVPVSEAIEFLDQGDVDRDRLCRPVDVNGIPLAYLPMDQSGQSMSDNERLLKIMSFAVESKQQHGDECHG